MKLKMCLKIEAVFVLAGFSWFAAIGGCGDLQGIADDITPNITVVNVTPGPAPAGDCDDCPGGIRIVELFAYEIEADTWGLFAALDGGCINPLMIKYAEAGLWMQQTNGAWSQVLSAPLADSVCLGNAMAWFPILQPCIGEIWCGLDDPWVSLTVENLPGFIDQAFVRPGGGLPIP